MPPIVLNQDKVLVDGRHRMLAVEQANRTEIAYVLVETTDEERLADLIWEANLKHGVQYTRDRRKAYGLKLHKRNESATVIAIRVGDSVNRVYKWTKAQRDKAKLERIQIVIELAADRKTQQDIAQHVEN